MFRAGGDADFPAVEFAQAANDGQTDAAADGATGTRTAVAAFEQPRGVFFAQARAGVFDAHLVGFNHQAHFAFGGVLAGVAQQVADGHRQHRLGCFDQGVFIAFAVHFQGFATQLGARGIGQLLAELEQRRVAGAAFVA